MQITHRLDEILDATRALVLDKGHIAWEGSLPALFDEEGRFGEWGLETPPLVRFARRLKERGLLANDCLPSVTGLLEHLCR